jgi:CBS domain-containing protein
MNEAAGRELTVGDVMHLGVVSSPPEAPLRSVAALMADYGVHAIVVLGDDEEGALWGIVSDTDLVHTIANGSLGVHSAGDLARPAAITVLPGETVAEAARLMRDRQVTHLVVVSQRGRPVGVVSTLDVVRAAARDHVDIRVATG